MLIHNYSFLTDWPCDTNLTKDNGQFASPRWPNMYPAHASCRWRIIAPPGGTIRVRFSPLELEDHIGSSCKTAYDKIDIYDGDFMASNHSRTICGNGGNTEYTSIGNVVLVLFTTDSRVQAKGFRASYSFIIKTTTTLFTTTTRRDETTVTLSISANTSDSYSSGSSLTQKAQNMSDSINMAIVSQHDDDKGVNIRLTAVFEEPSIDDGVFSDDNVTDSEKGRTSKF